MFRAGLPGEARRLFELGYTPEDPGLRAIGYREFFVRDETGQGRRWRLSEDLAGVEALVAQNSRRYAKRQSTFFASIPDVKWIDCREDDGETAEKIRRLITEELLVTLHSPIAQN
jgi:tRNA dimethylallyltransferase